MAEQERGVDPADRRTGTNCGRENEQRRAAHLQQLRAASALGNQISALESQVAAAQTVRISAATHGVPSWPRPAASSRANWLNIGRGWPSLPAQNNEREAAARRAAGTELAERRQQYARAQQELSDWRERHSGASERAALLDELERRLEGVSSGVKEMLMKAREATAGPFRQIRGLVADLLNVHMDTAPLDRSGTRRIGPVCGGCRLARAGRDTCSTKPGDRRAASVSSGSTCCRH